MNKKRKILKIRLLVKETDKPEITYNKNSDDVKIPLERDPEVSAEVKVKGTVDCMKI
ncbi:hypothetical protein DPMN_025973 [Dreissena polymorpha]|uniref:Uncharacterized protein n=1 Tax=Dreissena polymorpha TaxID=45954 RepID=A0A9D4RDT6_DREPO|nr:hypothetical protein DPMN_025973 [Dreissena polymorpha]